MKKSDLKTGYIITQRNGKEGIVILNAKSNYANCKDEENIVLRNKDSWDSLRVWDEDLTHFNYAGNDIVKIERIPHPYAFLDINYEREKRTLLWKRKDEKKSLTDKEIMQKAIETLRR